MQSARKPLEGSHDFDEANAAWNDYKASSTEIIQLSTNGWKKHPSLWQGMYAKYKLFGEKFNILRNDFQVKLEQSKAIANICINVIFYHDLCIRIAIGVVTTAIERTITASITEPVEQIEAAVASLRKRWTV